MKKLYQVFLSIIVVLLFSSCQSGQTYKITFYDDVNSLYFETSKKANESIDLPNDPVKEMFIFTGWDKDVPHFMPKKDLVFVATWELNKSSNEQVNALYTVLLENYYLDLNVDLRGIKEVYELYDYLDPYTFLYQESSRGIDQDENYVGLGITVNQLEEGLLIVNINNASEIDKYLYVGDLVTSVDGVLLKDVPADDRIPLILGEVGTKRTIGVVRFESYYEFDYYLKEINNESVEYELFGSVGYIYINRFGADTHNKFRVALETLEKNEITELVIDVRNDGGGYLTAVVDILYHFIVDSDPFLIIKDIKGEIEYDYNPLATEKKNYGITVLVNERSASASEVLAEALKQEGYHVFGTQTFGKDVFQGGYYIGRRFPNIFEENIILNYTAGYWLPNNRINVKNGVTPTKYHEQTGVHNYLYPVLFEKLSVGDEDDLIETFQYLVSRETSYKDISNKFTSDFEEALKIYQANNSLIVDGELNLETQMHLIDYYRFLIKNKEYDEQLVDLLNELNK